MSFKSRKNLQFLAIDGRTNCEILKHWPIITSFRGEIIRWKWHVSRWLSLFIKYASGLESKSRRKNVLFVFFNQNEINEAWEYKLFRNDTLISVSCVVSVDAVCVLVCADFVGFSCSKSRLNAWMPMSLENRRSAAPSDGDKASKFCLVESSFVSVGDLIVSPAPELNAK